MVGLDIGERRIRDDVGNPFDGAGAGSCRKDRLTTPRKGIRDAAHWLASASAGSAGWR